GRLRHGTTRPAAASVKLRSRRRLGLCHPGPQGTSCFSGDAMAGKDGSGDGQVADEAGPAGLLGHPGAALVPSEEVRFAVVLNGGVSLAVWMGGVVLELDRLTKAARSGTGA